MGEVSAYPLTWPTAWKRTVYREWPKFRSVTKRAMGGSDTVPVKLVDARERLSKQVDALGARYVTLSTNLELRLDGAPRAGQSEPSDPGAALYFQLRGKPIVLACDKWTTVAANIAAIAAHIEAMRGMDRWGVGSVEQMFNGYMALPAPMVVNDWRAVLGDPPTLAAAEATYREKIRTAHPDLGGTATAAAALNGAIAEARKVLE